MYGYIYETTNLVNGKKYIGQHASKTFDVTYHGSGLVFIKALKKYGKDNFKTRILEECSTESELNEKEIYYIDKFNAVADSNYYNTSFGGESNSRNMRTMYNLELDKVILSAECNIEYYEKLGYKLGMRPHSDDAIKNYKKAKKDKIPITNGYLTKYINKTDPIPNGWRKGRHKATRPNQKSEQRKWMYKDNKSIMVKGEDVQAYLDNGYKLDRVKFEYHRDYEKHPVWNKGKKIGDKCKPKKTL